MNDRQDEGQDDERESDGRPGSGQSKFEAAGPKEVKVNRITETSRFTGPPCVCTAGGEAR